VDVTAVDLKYLDYPDGTETVGCFSPCKKMVGGQWQGWKTKLGGLSDDSNEAQMYCCPNGVVSPEQCRTEGKTIAGKQVPAVAGTTQYAETVHQVCDTYAYSFDDRIGLVACDASVKYEMVFCPDGKSLALPPHRRPRHFCNSTLEGQMCYPPKEGVPCPKTEQACGTNPHMCKCPFPPPVFNGEFHDDLILSKGTATPLGGEDDNAWITMTGTFIHDSPPGLDFGNSEIELKKLLYEEGAGAELVKRSGEDFLPWHLRPRKWSNVSKGFYRNPKGVGPDMYMAIRKRDPQRGLYQFRLRMNQATIDIPKDCQLSDQDHVTDLMTEFEIVSNNVHAAIKTEAQWECKGDDPEKPSTLRLQ
jgi:hypothetical protein